MGYDSSFLPLPQQWLQSLYGLAGWGNTRGSLSNLLPAVAAVSLCFALVHTENGVSCQWLCAIADLAGLSVLQSKKFAGFSKHCEVPDIRACRGHM